MFYPVNALTLDAYDQGFLLEDFFAEKQIGLTTSRDHLAIDFNADALGNKLRRFVATERTDDLIRKEFYGSKKARNGLLVGDTSSWSLSNARKNLIKSDWEGAIKPIDYRPFDTRAVCYTPLLLERPREETIPQLFYPDNVALSFNRKIDEVRPFTDSFVFKNAIQLHSLSLKESNYFAPLYLYPDEQDLDQARRVNFDAKLWKKTPVQGQTPHPRYTGRSADIRLYLRRSALPRLSRYLCRILEN